MDSPQVVGQPGASAGPASAVARMFQDPPGAYLHVPFCSRICPFCPYNKVLPRGDLPARYFQALRTEVARYREAGLPGPGGFTSVYVGGGTPTLFLDELESVLAAVPTSGERAVEVLPTHLDRLPALRAMGVDAVSIGAQSLDDRLLRRLRRPHDAATALAAIRAAVGTFPLVDVDLIVDAETEGDAQLRGAFLRDLATCLDLGADQVSAYPLMRFGYTPFGRARHDRHREHTLLARATELAAARGYERRSVWTFNRLGSPGYSSITRRRFLGMGAGASSFAGADFLVNHFGLDAYIAALADDRLPIAHRLHLGAAGGTAYEAFWQAYSGRIVPADLAASPGGRAVVRGLCQPLRLTGLVTDNGGRFALTAAGFDVFHDLERAVTYALIEPLWAQMLDEQRREGLAAWVDAGRARRGLAWRAVDRVLVRPMP